jgi:hypothetical protein
MDMSTPARNDKGTIPAPADLLDRMERAVERVRDRLRRATTALEDAEIPYAVVGEQAVACWVRGVEEGAERFSRAAEILMNRCDLEKAETALTRAGFAFRPLGESGTFLDGSEAKDRDAVQILFAVERARPGDEYPAPEVRESEQGDRFRVISLEALVGMKLASFRRIDRVNMRDMIDVGLVDESWLPRLPARLAERLRELLENPER